MPFADTLLKFKAITGPKGYVDDAATLAPHLVEWRGLYQGRCAALLAPQTTQEVSDILRLAHETGTAIVPQGGNTGLVGGQIPFKGDEIILSLSRMKALRALDPLNNTLTVEAGMTLAEVQSHAREVGRLFPLSLASEGSCQIGGNLSTNAGGTAVLRYGNARDLVLGLEVVLADGRVLSSLKGLRKDNTGYDLKQLFLGSEGTLGIITAAVLKLFVEPKSIETAFVAVPSVEAAVDLLRLAEGQSGGLVSTFELVPRIGLEFIENHLPGASDPLAAPSPWYVLVEMTAGSASLGLDTLIEQFLSDALSRGLISDAAVAQSESQRQSLWQLRESLSEIQKHEGGSIKHDVSVPVSSMAAFIAKASAAVVAAMPGIRPVPFGHIGDGNVHFNLSQPVGMDKAAYLAHWDEMNAIVHAIVREMGGSISAEHGVGHMKRDEIAAIKSPVEMDLMRALKMALDPKNILNPGKVVDITSPR
ncbi:MAG: FAD-binding protein [Rhizobiales bacterium]|nr:FAD-binding protein [Hyphomicrobiales bacterium]